MRPCRASECPGARVTGRREGVRAWAPMRAADAANAAFAAHSLREGRPGLIGYPRGPKARGPIRPHTEPRQNRRHRCKRPR